MSLRKIVESAGLTLDSCADVLGVDRDLFYDWADLKREIPPSFARDLSAILGVKAEVLTSKAFALTHGSKFEPSAIWFKFRGNEFTDRDRESVLLLRRLGHNANQLEKVTLGEPNRAWTLLFEMVLKRIDLQASPAEQGIMAAQAFCALTQFGSGGTGSAEFLRGNLRAKGILVIESPLPGSQVEGCSFLVGESSDQRPCIFVNTFCSTWFRRNVVIMHELGHALFDQTSGPEIDTLIDKRDSAGNSVEVFSEVRAESFARECLLPRKLVLSFCSQNGVSPTRLTAESLAALVAFSGVEKKTVIEILRNHELIDDALMTQYQTYEIAQHLRNETDHALSTSDFIQKIGLKAAGSWLNKRFTTIGTQRLLLPVNYVKTVVDAVRSFNISIGRAAELLMIDRDTFISRVSSAPEVVFFHDTDALTQIFIAGQQYLLRALGLDYNVRSFIMSEVEAELRSKPKLAGLIKPQLDKSLKNGWVEILTAKHLDALGSARQDKTAVTLGDIRELGAEYHLDVQRGEAYTIAAGVLLNTPCVSNDGNAIRTLEARGKALPPSILRSFDIFGFFVLRGVP
jgi:Zn-dependent peptidase ImmA (M78 family)